MNTAHPPSKSPRVLYVAVQNRTYPRNHRIRSFLEESMGASVEIIDLSARPGFLRHGVELLAEGLRKRGNFDYVFLAEFSGPFAFVSWILAKRFRAKHVVDYFVGQYETHIEDRAAASPGSLKARIYRSFDWIALNTADIVLCDTAVRADAASAKRNGRTAINVPVGAPSWARTAGRAASQASDDVRAPGRFLYYGNYVPLHGVGHLLRAFAMLRASETVSLTMVGDGEERMIAEELVKELGISDSVQFTGPVAENDLAGIISTHDVVLGIFGESPKAASVIANKVWQGLAGGKLVVTRSSLALREIEDIAGHNLIQVQIDELQGLAGALALAKRSIGSESRGIGEALETYVADRYKVLGATLASQP